MDFFLDLCALLLHPILDSVLDTFLSVPPLLTAHQVTEYPQLHFISDSTIYKDRGRGTDKRLSSTKSRIGCRSSAQRSKKKST